VSEPRLTQPATHTATITTTQRVGHLKITGDGLAWQSKQGATEAVPGADLRAAQWLPIGPRYQLKLTLKGGACVKFDGFPAKVRERERERERKKEN
jgi:hypothetical protein